MVPRALNTDLLEKASGVEPKEEAGFEVEKEYHRQTKTERN